MNISLKSKLHIFICICVILSSSDIAMASMVKYYYEAIVSVHSIDDRQTLNRARQKNSPFEIRKNPTENIFFLVKKTPIRNEQDMISAMGGHRESDLNDSQKALLDTYRFSKDPRFRELEKYLPSSKKRIILQLSDISGFENVQGVETAFWPRNASSDYASTIKISIVAETGTGAEMAESLKQTYAHEFGHSFDKMTLEANAFGKDNAHLGDEIITPKAAFKEGWAHLLEMIMYGQSAELEYRELAKTLETEDKNGHYAYIPLDSKPLNMLRNESVLGLILYDLYKNLPGEEDRAVKRIYDALNNHNSRNNNISKFLRNMMLDNPEYTSVIMQVLDKNTFSLLSDTEFKSVLGNSPEVDAYLVNRGHNTDASIRKQSASVPLSKKEQDEKFQKELEQAIIECGATKHIQKMSNPNEVNNINTTNDFQNIEKNNILIIKSSTNKNPFSFGRNTVLENTK